MAPSHRPDKPEADQDALSTLVDQPVPALDGSSPVIPDTYEEADTSPAKLPDTLGGSTTETTRRRRFEEAPTEAHPAGVPIDDWIEEWPPADPFGEAETVARKREEVSPDEATVAVGTKLLPEILEDHKARGPSREALRDERAGPTQARKRTAPSDAEAVDEVQAPSPLTPMAPPPRSGARKGDAEATIKVPAVPPDEVKSLRAESRSLVPRRRRSETNRSTPAPSDRVTPHSQNLDPEQALGFMTVGLLVGLAMSALVGSVVAGWLFTAQ